MTTVSTDDPQFLSAIQACAVALRINIRRLLAALGISWKAEA